MTRCYICEGTDPKCVCQGYRPKKVVCPNCNGKKCYLCDEEHPTYKYNERLKRHPMKSKADSRIEWLHEIWLALRRFNSINVANNYQSTFLIRLDGGRQVQMTTALDIEIKRLFGDWRKR